MTNNSDLSFVTTDELVEELLKRHTTAAIALVNMRTDQKGHWRFQCTGDQYAVLGLLSRAKSFVNKNMKTQGM